VQGAILTHSTFFIFCQYVKLRTKSVASLRFSGKGGQLICNWVYGREMYETWYKMTAMIQSGLDISPVITHHFPYAQFKEAIELMKSGNSGKIVLDLSER
jgi:NADPH:quinone reductase-like Zn-dependent oxidoreductase